MCFLGVLLVAFVDEIWGYVQDWGVNESLTAEIRKQMINSDKVVSKPKDYFFVTHLSNPMQAYWDLVGEGTAKPPELRRKLAQGKWLQGLASIWFRLSPNFVVEEGKLDGAFVDLRGVRGSIDYLIGDAIIELKTKDSLPETPEAVLSLYPHDLEQLTFYSVLHPLLPRENFLVFMQNSRPYKIAAFKVVIKNPDKIKSVIISRMKLLRSAIEEKNPQKLGQCRYFETLCQYSENGVCNCEKVAPIAKGILGEAVEVTYDEKFTAELEDLKEQSNLKEADWFTYWEIFNPRLHYMNRIEGEDNFYDSGLADLDKDAYAACLWAAIKNIKKKFGLDLKERQEIISWNREPRIRTGFKWLKIPQSGKHEYDIIPYIQKVSEAASISSAKSPNGYHLAQLAVTCATYGRTNGVIFVVYPRLNKLVRVFHVTFKQTDALLATIKKRMSECQKAENEKNPLILTACPSFLNSSKNCPMTKICHSEKGSGCIPTLLFAK